MNRTLSRAALSLLFLAAAAAPALAHEPGEKAQKQKIIIMTERHGDGRAEIRDGDSKVVIADCGGDKTEFSGGDEAKGEKARVVICTRGNVSSADRARRLEHVLERINSDDALSAETKAKIGTALRDAIARLNTAH
jgi:hypothetical protein